MTTNYEWNERQLDRAMVGVDQWARYVDPETAKQEIRSSLLGALMAMVDPGAFAAALAAAEDFAGKPVQW